MYNRRNCASSWLPTRIIVRCYKVFPWLPQDVCNALFRFLAFIWTSEHLVRRSAAHVAVKCSHYKGIKITILKVF